MIGSVLPGVEHLQNTHPLFVHFPIAFLFGAAFFYFLCLGLRRESLANTAVLLLVLGALSAAAAAGTGLYAEDGVMVSRSVRSHLLEMHETLMLVTAGLSILMALWAVFARPYPKKGRLFFFLLLILLLGVMTVGADHGARMVYDYNAGGSACSQPIEFTK
jgi:uncharacterized membrane protein